MIFSFCSVPFEGYHQELNGALNEKQMKKEVFSTEIGGKTLTATFSDLVDQADGSVLLQYGDTVVLATAVMSDRLSEGMNYFPLKIDYEEKFYAAGQILGSRFMRREGRPSDEAVLSGRVVDRTLRPLFNQSIRNEVQVIVTVLSIGEDDPDFLAVNAASLALATSDIPWDGPTSAVRIGKTKEGAPVVNPGYDDRKQHSLAYDVLVCGKDGTINMIETEAIEIDEKELVDAMQKGIDELKVIEQFQKDIVAKIGKEKRVVPIQSFSDELKELFKDVEGKLYDAVICGETGKKSTGALKEEWLELVEEKLEEVSKTDATDYFEEKVNDVLHQAALKDGKRADGRGFGDVRNIFAQAGGIAPMTHGQGVFYRGETHVLSVLTLGSPQDSLIVDSIEEQDEQKRFMHHYNFPPYSVGETGRVGGMNRRAIGHGALAEKALRAVIPQKEAFPYTIRLVSESMASNGSTSMASVCGSTVALMDGGVPIRRPVAGIAMGLMSEGSDYKILTDIQGPEDHHGDMDFKVAGTREGVTAIQMDVKVSGIELKILAEALEDAKKARLHILDIIEAEIAAPRDAIAPHAPQIVTLTVPVDSIGKVIGSGGKTINGIKDDTGVEDINIEDDGTIFITGKGPGVAQAQKIIEDLTHEYKVGERLEGEVVRLADFGAFVKLNEFSDGLVHVSEIAPFRVEKVEQVLSIGQKVPVIIKKVEQDKIGLSIKDADPNFVKKPEGNDGGKQPETK